MGKFWKMIFKSTDSTRSDVTAAVEASRIQREQANSRFEQTVEELLQVNDHVTGRNKRNGSQAHT